MGLFSSYNFRKSLYKKLLADYKTQLMAHCDFDALQADNYITANSDKVDFEVNKAVFMKAGEFTETVANKPANMEALNVSHKRYGYTKHEIFGDREIRLELTPVNEFLDDPLSMEELNKYIKEKGLPSDIKLQQVLSGDFNGLVAEFYRHFLGDKQFRLYKPDAQNFTAENVYMFPWQYLRVAGTKGGDCEDKAIFFTRLTTMPAKNSLSPEDYKSILMPLVHVVAGDLKNYGGHVQASFLDTDNLMTHRVAETTLHPPRGQNEDSFFSSRIRNVSSFDALPVLGRSAECVENLHLAFNDARIWNRFNPTPPKKDRKQFVAEAAYAFDVSSFNW
ncbi:MAG: hypothetical protein NTU57_02840 [Candidatus Aenigmarchaeota archaeon]|nr:hypothetical protein [Candidatus Aenigmarchaeota archaeon]